MIRKATPCISCCQLHRILQTVKLDLQHREGLVRLSTERDNELIELLQHFFFIWVGQMLFFIFF